MNKTELRAQLPNLDPASRRRLVEANLNKLAPLGFELHKWRYETQSAPDHRPNDWRNSNRHTATVSTCLACWEWRLAQYEGRV